MVCQEVRVGTTRAEVVQLPAGRELAQVAGDAGREPKHGEVGRPRLVGNVRDFPSHALAPRKA